MLVLTRKTQQQIQIGDNITITIVRVTGQSVRVGIQAPEEVRVVRGELVGKPAKKMETVEVVAAAPSLPSGNTKGSEEASVATLTSQAAPLAARCRSRLMMPTMASTAAVKSCESAGRRVPGASFTSMNRRPQRLGPASLGSMCRMR